MNENQKYVLGIIVSIGLFIIAYAIAGSIHHYNAFSMRHTWFPWLVMTGLIGFLWFKLLDNEN